MELDVTIVATRRPDLLRQTLQSFERNLLRNVGVGAAFLNIDPIWGSEADDHEVEQLVRGLRPRRLEIRRPDSAGFGAAVKWLWSKPQSHWFLHLEDDWLLQREVSARLLRRRLAADRFAQISLLRRADGWKKSVHYSKFTTGPSVMLSAFAHRASELMREELDPEKQLYSGTNLRLEAEVSRFRRRYLGSRFTPSYIVDIGRPWRASRGIEKSLVHGASVWREEEPQSSGKVSRLGRTYETCQRGGGVNR